MSSTSTPLDWPTYLGTLVVVVIWLACWLWACLTYGKRHVDMSPYHEDLAAGAALLVVGIVVGFAGCAGILFVSAALFN